MTAKQPTIAETVKEARTRLGLSQEKLARALKVSFPTVNRWENDKNQPDQRARHSLAELLRDKGPEFRELADRIDGGDAVPSAVERPKRGRRPRAAQTALPTDATTLDTKSMEGMLWKAACSIRGEKDAPKFKDYILPLLFLKRLSDVFEDEVARLAETYGDADTALAVLDEDHSLVRFYIPEVATWPVLAGRKQIDWPAGKAPKTLGERLTNAVRAVARANPSLQGVVDIVDFNETRNGEREVSDDALHRIIERFSEPRYRLGLKDVEADFLGRAYEYLLRKFAEGQGQSAGEFFTPKEVGWLIAHLVEPKQGEEVYDYCCGSAGLLIKCELRLLQREKILKRPLQLHGQELTGSSFAIARMNMVLHDMEGEIVRGNTMTNPKFLDGSRLRRFDVVVANPMWNQDNIDPSIYESDPYERFTSGYAPNSGADWAWLQHTVASLTDTGRAAVVLDTGAVSRGSGSQGDNKEKAIRKAFVENDWIEGVILLPENLFYNTPAAGVIVVLNRAKSKERRGRVVLINASGEFEKGRPKNFLTEDGIARIGSAFHAGIDVPRFVKIVESKLIAATDYNLLPSLFVDTSVATVHREPREILQSLVHLEKQASETSSVLSELVQTIEPRTSGVEHEVSAQAHSGSRTTSAGRDLVLPSHWQSTTIGALFDVQQGKAIGPESRRGISPRPFLRTKNVLWGRLDLVDLDTMDFADYEAEKLTLQPGDLLTCEGGDIGRTAIWRDEVPGCLYQNHIHRLRRKTDNVLPEYAMYWLKSAFLQLGLFSGVGNKTTIPNLSAGRLKELFIPLPSVSEQEAIVRVLLAAERAIEQAQSRRTIVEELSSALLETLMTGSSRLPNGVTAMKHSANA